MNIIPRWAWQLALTLAGLGIGQAIGRLLEHKP